MQRLVAVSKRGIDEIIDELTEQAATATIVVPEREHVAREPRRCELAPYEHDPSVLVDENLWLDLERAVACKPLATGTISPPVGAYCVVEPVPDTEETPILDAHDIEELEIEIVEDY